MSYANPKTGPLIESVPVPACPKTVPTRSGRRWPGLRLPAACGADLSAACAERESDCVLVLSCRKGCFLRTVPAGENLPSGCWISSGARRQTSLRLKGQASCLPAGLQRRMFCRPQPRRHPLRRVCMTLLVLALLAALAAVGAWECTNGNFYALPEQLHTLLTEHIPRPGATLV